MSFYVNHSWPAHLYCLQESSPPKSESIQPSVFIFRNKPSFSQGLVFFFHILQISYFYTQWIWIFTQTATLSPFPRPRNVFVSSGSLLVYQRICQKQKYSLAVLIILPRCWSCICIIYKILYLAKVDNASSFSHLLGALCIFWSMWWQHQNFAFFVHLLIPAIKPSDYYRVQFFLRLFKFKLWVKSKIWKLQS